MKICNEISTFTPLLHHSRLFLHKGKTLKPIIQIGSKYTPRGPDLLLNRHFPKNVCLVAVDSVHERVVGDLEKKMVSRCFFYRSKSHPPAAESLLALLWPGDARLPRLARMAGRAPPPCSRLHYAAAGQGLPQSAIGGK